MRTVVVTLSVIAMAVCTVLGQEQIQAPKHRVDEGKLVAENKRGEPLHWTWHLEAKDYRWHMGMPNDSKTGKSKGVAELAQKLEGKQVVVTSRVGYFSIGEQKTLLVQKIEPKQK